MAHSKQAYHSLACLRDCLHIGCASHVVRKPGFGPPANTEQRLTGFCRARQQIAVQLEGCRALLNLSWSQRPGEHASLPPAHRVQSGRVPISALHSDYRAIGLHPIAWSTGRVERLLRFGHACAARGANALSRAVRSNGVRAVVTASMLRRLVRRVTREAQGARRDRRSVACAAKLPVERDHAGAPRPDPQCPEP